MDKKVVKEYLILTFIIMFLGWGLAAILSQTVGLNLLDSILLKVLFVIGGFSPTIASFVVLKRNNKIKNFKEWIKSIFDVKHSLKTYALVILFLVIYFGIGCLLNDFKLGMPIYLQFLLVIATLFGGGNEEAGWRMILQPELEKKFNFNISTLITGVIWWLWHFPIFYIKGSPNETLNYLIFGVMCIALAYALAAVRKISSGVFPCVLLHSAINSFTATFIFKFNLPSILVVLLVNVIIANILVYFKDKKEKDVTM